MAMRRAATATLSATAARGGTGTRARARPMATATTGTSNVFASDCAPTTAGQSTAVDGFQRRHRQQHRRGRQRVALSSSSAPPPRAIDWRRSTTPPSRGLPRSTRAFLSTKTSEMDERDDTTTTPSSGAAEAAAASSSGDEAASSSAAAEDGSPGGDSGASSSSSGDERDKDDDDGAGGKGEGGKGEGGGAFDGFRNFQPPDARDVIDKVATAYSAFKTGVASTWRELLDSGGPRDVNKVIHAPAPTRRPDDGDHSGERENVDDEAANRYDGSGAVMVVDEELGAWEKMQRRLAEAPIIKGILGASHEVLQKAGVADAKKKIDDIREDAAEAWETSQNPWVYRLSSVWDTVTAESEFALATRELQRLDPSFTLEGFKVDVMGHTIPQVMGWFLEGKTKELKPWLGEAVYNRLAAEIRVRKQEGLVIDPHILGIENSEILAAEIDELNKGSPIILLHFMCQQINCVRKKDGTVAEGGEDEIRANSYIVALQREYDEVEGALKWKIVDFRFNGGIPWV